MANFHKAHRPGIELRLMLPEDLPDAAFPNIPPHGCRIRFTAHHDPEHRLVVQCRSSRFVPPEGPQIKEFSSSELSSLDEIFEGRLPADPLLRAEPFIWLQRLYLGQLFPALFAATRKDFPSSGSPRAG